MQKTKTYLYENRKTLKRKNLKMQHFTSLFYKNAKPPLIVIRLLRGNYSLPLYGCLLHCSVLLVVVGALLVMVRL